MAYDDDYDDSRPRWGNGVSPVWQVLGIAGLLGTVALLLLSLGLAASLVRERVAQQNPARMMAPPAPAFAPMAFPGAGAEGDAGEPPNPPYPLKQDLRLPGSQVVPGEEPQEPRPRTARQRFLDLGQLDWTVPEGEMPQQLTVSADGQHVAYMQQQQLMAGQVGGAIQAVDGDSQRSGAPGGFSIPGMIGPGGIQPPAKPLRAVGFPMWANDNQHVLFADAEGALRRYDAVSPVLETLPFHGDSPVTMPGDPDKVVFRRSRAVPKLDRPDRSATPDPSEVVVADLNTQEVRLLVPVSDTVWEPLAVSPDGKKLALASDHGLAKKEPGTRRLFLLDLDTDKAEPRPVGPPCPRLGTVAWAADSKSLVYSHGQNPSPTEWWEGDDTEWGGLDVFHLDLATGRETRLSRGGVRELSPTPGDAMFLLVSQGQPRRQRLMRVPVAAALDFARKEGELPPRTQEAWIALIDRVLEETHLPPDASGDKLTEEGLAGIADTFAKLFRERFRAEPPADAEGWERQRRELDALNLPRTARSRFTLVLGAAHGEYLHRRHNAVWSLSAGPLIPPSSAPPEPTQESPFCLVLNPFAEAAVLSGGDGDDEGSSSGWSWVKDALIRAEGRVVVLANDPAAGRAAADKLADEALERATKLFGDKKENEAERVLLKMMKEKKHETNRYLTLHVGRLLFEHKRFEALRGLMEKQLLEPPPDARVYNLLGLAVLEADPDGAINHFKDALRCDLYFGPGYLNLSQAYEKSLKRDEAEWCLRRYLKLLPFGPNASDARQRLASLEQSDGPAPGGQGRREGYQREPLIVRVAGA
jgi:hypothetical protein